MPPLGTQNRRKFIQTSSAAALGLALAPYGFKKRKAIGLQLYTVRDQMKEDVKSTLKKLAQIGYSELETAGYSEGKIYNMAPKDFKALVADLGFTLPSGHYGPPHLQGDWEKAVEDAATVGHKYMVCAWLPKGERETMDDFKRYLDLFHKSGEICKKAGIQFAYHNHAFEFVDMGDELAMDYLIKNSDKSLLQFELDLFWVKKAGYDPVTYFHQYPGRFPLWHVKDMDNSPEKTFTEVGNGVIDFEKIFQEASTSGLKHYFVEQDKCKRPPLESVEISFKNLSKIV